MVHLSWNHDSIVKSPPTRALSGHFNPAGIAAYQRLEAAGTPDSESPASLKLPSSYLGKSSSPVISSSAAMIFSDACGSR